MVVSLTKIGYCHVILKFHILVTWIWSKDLCRWFVYQGSWWHHSQWPEGGSNSRCPSEWMVDKHSVFIHSGILFRLEKGGGNVVVQWVKTLFMMLASHVSTGWSLICSVSMLMCLGRQWMMLWCPSLALMRVEASNDRACRRRITWWTRKYRQCAHVMISPRSSTLAT